MFHTHRSLKDTLHNSHVSIQTLLATTLDPTALALHEEAPIGKQHQRIYLLLQNHPHHGPKTEAINSHYNTCTSHTSSRASCSYSSQGEDPLQALVTVLNPQPHLHRYTNTATLLQDKNWDRPSGMEHAAETDEPRSLLSIIQPRLNPHGGEKLWTNSNSLHAVPVPAV